MNANLDREALVDAPNPLGMEGIEFVEYATSTPQALGQTLEMMGFHLVARHRSREVALYRQGELNVVVNAHGRASPAGTPAAAPFIAAVAFRVRDAAQAYSRALERGAWPIEPQVQVMELNIPAVHGVGQTRIYLVDRYREFSIYDVDFIPVPRAEPRHEPICGMHFFGLVQYIGAGRLFDWCEFYAELFGFSLLPEDRHFGILPKGRILQSPCRSFYLQLIEPPAELFESTDQEELHRMALGAPDVLQAVAALSSRQVEFVESEHVRPNARGALTRNYLGGVSFELVCSPARFDNC